MNFFGQGSFPANDGLASRRLHDLQVGPTDVLPGLLAWVHEHAVGVLAYVGDVIPP